MLITESFGIRIKEEEIRELVVKHLLEQEIVVSADDVEFIPLTNSKFEVKIRQFQKIKK